MKFYAHSVEGDPDTSRWQKLEDHLISVANLAAEFAEPFHSKEWGHLAGLWHDLGKYQPEFQQRLQGKRVSVEHSGAGAALAIRKDKDLGLGLAFVIAGHHAGLANPSESGPGFPSPLRQRLKENEIMLCGMLPNVPTRISEQGLPALPLFLQHRRLGPKEFQ